MGHQRERDTERARQTLPREGPTLHLDHGAAVLHLETKGIRQSIARAFLRGDGESAQSQINHSDDDHTHTHTLTPPPLPMRIDPRANHSGSRVPLSGSILLPPAQSGSLSARQCSPSQVVCAICIALACIPHASTHHYDDHIINNIIYY